MKKFVSLLVFSFWTLIVSGQILNGGFEDWAYDPQSQTCFPVDWIVEEAFERTIDKDSFAFEGLTSLKLKDGLGAHPVCHSQLSRTFDLSTYDCDTIQVQLAYMSYSLREDEKCGLHVRINERTSIEIVSESDSLYNTYILNHQRLEGEDTLKIEIWTLASTTPTDACLNLGVHWIDSIDIINNENCSTVNSTTIGKANDSSITLYPNPVSQYLYVGLNDKVEFELTIYNGNGTKVLSQRNPKQIDFDQFESGIYYIEIADINSKNKVIRKIVKEN